MEAPAGASQGSIGGLRGLEESSTLSVTVNVIMSSSTNGARGEFGTSVQAYADRLVRESEKQEISNRPPGVMFPEITSNSVVRAREALNKYGTRAKPSSLESVALAGVSVFSASTGVFGSYLNSTWQVASFSASAFIGAVCVIYLIARRLI